jgi:glycosyltransferase involved in cell wall biosynthesis
MKITIIYPTEPSYVVGLIDGLSKINNLQIDLIGTNRTLIVANKYNNINHLNFRGDQNPNAGKFEKISRIISFYLKLFGYTFRTESKIFHIHWANKFFFFDFTVLNLFYKILGKKIVYTAHNIDQGMRDKGEGFNKLLVYKILYNIVDHIIVHNNYSKRILIEKFKVPEKKISVNKLGINKIASRSGLTKESARAILNLTSNSKVILFFGGLNPYKGLENLIDAFSALVKEDNNFKLIIAGQPRDSEYFKLIKNKILSNNLNKYCLTFFDFIPNEEVEKFFIAADCCVLPYKFIFQSGVHALSFAFGLPVIATDVGSFKEEDIIENETGFVCEKNDAMGIKNAISKYFKSSLYKDLDVNRIKIKLWAENTYSWDSIGLKTFEIYKKLVEHSK